MKHKTKSQLRKWFYIYVNIIYISFKLNYLAWNVRENKYFNEDDLNTENNLLNELKNYWI